MMQTIKETAIDAISSLPEGVGMEEIMYQLYVIDKISKGERDIETGNMIDVDKLRREISSLIII